jgi:hypothetical protein
MNRPLVAVALALASLNAPGYEVNNDGAHMIVTDVQGLSGPRFLRLRVELVP